MRSTRVTSAHSDAATMHFEDGGCRGDHVSATCRKPRWPSINQALPMALQLETTRALLQTDRRSAIVLDQAITVLFPMMTALLTSRPNGGAVRALPLGNERQRTAVSFHGTVWEARSEN